jgi:hypothetical protein
MIRGDMPAEQVEGQPASLVIERCQAGKRRLAVRPTEIFSLYELCGRIDVPNRPHG